MARDGFTVTVVGGAALKRKLGRLEESLRGQVLENAVTAGALLVANRWKQLAAYRTGTYRRSVHVGGHTDRTPDFAQGPAQDGVEFHDVGGAIATRDYAEVKVGTDVPYARRLEYGFFGTDRLGRRYHQAPRPAARPAFDETHDDVTKEIGEAVKDQLRAIAKATS
jgi:hypothetical protein